MASRNSPPTNIDLILCKGDVANGHRSLERAEALLPSFKAAFHLVNSNAELNRTMRDFIAEAILGAAWYQQRCQGANRKVWIYIVANCAAVIGLPLALIELSRLVGDGKVTTQIASAATTLLTGILGLQRLLAAWYASQQRYAAWYKAASDLKTIYYGLVQDWAGKAERHREAFRIALALGAAAARKIITDERLDFYRRLTLPSFDILTLLTTDRAAVAGMVASTMPVRQAPSSGASGNDVAVATVPPASPSTPEKVSSPLPANINEFVPVPGGLQHSSRIRQVPPGATLPAPGRAPQSAILPGPVGAANWITYAYNPFNSAVTIFAATWTVPDDPPKQGSQVIFLFNGLQIYPSLILQPVLQWGAIPLPGGGSLNGTGQFWTVACWCVRNGGYDSADHTNPVRVSPGDQLTGKITLVSQAAGQFTYRCEFQDSNGNGIGAPLAATVPVPFEYGVVALEAYEGANPQSTPYDLDSVAEYPAPGPVVFRNIEVTTNPAGALSGWGTQDPPSTAAPAYGEHVVVVDDGTPNLEISIYLAADPSNPSA